MQFSWQYLEEEPRKVRTFLIQHGVSHRMFAKIKHDGGRIEVNDKSAYTSDYLKTGDRVMIEMPPEPSNELVTSDFSELDVVYEDDHWLVVNKPPFINTVPGHADRLHTLVNRVKGHLVQNDAENQVPHVVTRLDRDTSGLVLMTKHKFAHAVLDAQLQAHTVEKFYTAVVSGVLSDDHGDINAPIGRMDDDFIKREVRDDGRQSRTEYWVVKRYADFTVVKVQLHTGRTHQIRVHFKYIGHPLVGDELYGGPIVEGLERQALNAYHLSFFDPFADQQQTYEVGMPTDIQNFLNQYEK